MNTPTLEELLVMARDKVNAMSTAEKQAMIDEQARSWMRAERRFGSDAQEAWERAFYRQNGELPK